MARAEGVEVPPVPIGMYVDGVPYLKRGHFVALWVYNLLTGVRHVIVVFKKEAFCGAFLSNRCHSQVQKSEMRLSKGPLEA